MKLASVMVGGLQVELEERTCVGGCGKKFRVLPSSTARTARRNCESACKGTIDEAIKALGIMNRGAKKPTGPKPGKKDLPARGGKREEDDAEDLDGDDFAAGGGEQEGEGSDSADADDVFEIGEEAS